MTQRSLSIEEGYGHNGRHRRTSCREPGAHQEGACFPCLGEEGPEDAPRAPADPGPDATESAGVLQQKGTIPDRANSATFRAVPAVSQDHLDEDARLVRHGFRGSFGVQYTWSI